MSGGLHAGGKHPRRHRHRRPGISRSRCASSAHGWPTRPPASPRASRQPGLRAELTQQISAMQLRAQVAREITANLQQVEQVLDAYARGTAARDALPALAPLLHQIHGALAVLGLDRAGEVLAACDAMMHAPGEIDMDWIAEGLSSLGFYLEPCLRGANRASRRSISFSNGSGSAPPRRRSRLQRRRQRRTKNCSRFFSKRPQKFSPASKRPCRCAAPNPATQRLWRQIRRGFHTLKGSGRMVGLNELGEVAWEVEQVMNRWLEDQRPAIRRIARSGRRCGAPLWRMGGAAAVRAADQCRCRPDHGAGARAHGGGAQADFPRGLSQRSRRPCRHPGRPIPACCAAVG